jgi:hypothetical protein
MSESDESDDEEDPRVAMRERWHRIIDREMNSEPFVPRHIPDSEYLDATFTLQIHPGSLKHTHWPYVKKVRKNWVSDLNSLIQSSYMEDRQDMTSSRRFIINGIQSGGDIVKILKNIAGTFKLEYLHRGMA